MATLKEFEEELKAQGMRQALAILERLKARDRARRQAARPARHQDRRHAPEPEAGSAAAPASPRRRRR